MRNSESLIFYSNIYGDVRDSIDYVHNEVGLRLGNWLFADEIVCRAP